MIPVASAQDYTVAAASFVDRINNAIIFPLVSLMLGVAVLVFVWGGYQYLLNADNATARSEGQKHMLFGIIGIVVMISAFTILTIAVRTFFGDAVIPAP
jgi:high-affinity Fe2+/Pb2+ permease